MSGIYIPDMEMPTSCHECVFGKYEVCQINLAINGKDHPSCPLIPVPEHGDLIDRDAATKKIWDDMRFPSNLANAQFFVNELREMPAIIPADPEKEVEG